MTLLAAVILIFFSSGRWAIPLAAWLSPPLLLRWTRDGQASARLLGAAAAVYVVWCVTWWRMVPVPPPAYFVIMLGIAVPTLLPYLIDRMLGSKRRGFAFTLVFPCAWVFTDFLITRTSPYGSWGLIAYTQVDQLPLMQSASVTGLWGIGFLMAWFASVVNWAWDARLAWAEVRSGSITFLSVLGAVLLLGGARLALAPPRSDTLRVASFTIRPPSALAPGRLLTFRGAGGELDSLRAEVHAHEDSIFARVRRETSAGAQLVLCSEVNVLVFKDDQDAFEARAGALARETNAHLVFGAAVFTPGLGYYENEWLAFDPAGGRRARYHKARPVPGDPERGADASIPVFQTALGRIAGAVCFDADFPDLIGRAGLERADLLIVPASDWRAIDPIHTRMALVRGIENGCSVVRQTNQGLSAAADYEGRIVSSADFFRAAPAVMVAQVPSRGVWTFYPRFPDLLPYICIIALALVGMGALLAAIRGRERPHASLPSGARR
jgi:apolipoprotein N-acyltransferase